MNKSFCLIIIVILTGCFMSNDDESNVDISGSYFGGCSPDFEWGGYYHIYEFTNNKYSFRFYDESTGCDAFRDGNCTADRVNRGPLLKNEYIEIDSGSYNINGDVINLKWEYHWHDTNWVQDDDPFQIGHKESLKFKIENNLDLSVFYEGGDFEWSKLDRETITFPFYTEDYSACSSN